MYIGSVVANADRRILVVDDVEHAAGALSFLFSFVGYEVRIANCGRAALNIVESFEPHVITLDIDLGDMSGFEVARAIRARNDGAKTFIVAVTGRSEAECRPFLADNSIDAFVSKPVDFDQLQSICDQQSARVTAR